MANEKSNTEKKKVHFKGERTRSTLIISGSLIVFLLTLHLNFNAALSSVARVGFTAITGLVCVCGTYELIRAVGGKSKVLFTVAGLFSAGYTIVTAYHIAVPHSGVLLCFYALLLLVLAVIFNQSIKYIEAVMAFFGSLGLTYALSCAIRLNDLPYLNDRFTHLEGLYLFWLSFGCAWLTDVFAFLVGRKLGKHKMSPHISPKKSWEGAVGGTLITVLFNLGILFVYSLIAKHALGYAYFLMRSGIKYLYVIPVSVILSVIGMFGDLSASVLKRNVGIKDFSNLLPGHGGIIDRFDSCTFVLPTMYGIMVLVADHLPA